MKTDFIYKYLYMAYPFSTASFPLKHLNYQDLLEKIVEWLCIPTEYPNLEILETGYHLKKPQSILLFNPQLKVDGFIFRHSYELNANEAKI